MINSTEHTAPRSIDGWRDFVTTVHANFPGPDNRALRQRIFRLGTQGETLAGIKQTVALTASGKAGLAECQRKLDTYLGVEG